MPQVTVATNLEFTNHWIGIYDGENTNLMPVRRAVKTLQPSLAPTNQSAPFLAPSSPSTLRPVYEKALALREKELGAQEPKVARSASDLGLFLAQSGDAAGAEPPLRKALAIDQANRAPELAADRENLAGILEKSGKREEASQLYRQAAAGSDSKVAARSYASLARLDPPHAAAYLRNAVNAMSLAYGKDDRRVAVLLHELALVLREEGNDGAAEPLLRRALTIQETAANSDQHLTVEILNALGNLMEGARQFDQAEVLLRRVLFLAEREFGPESVELSASCTNLADVLWNKHDLASAEQLYDRALAADSALYGANSPEAAADMTNLGMLLKEAGRPQEAAAWLRQALGIFEQTLGPDSAQANLVRQGLAK
jgi:Tfp pilus assembly protein PilF